jgi:hypothetical protein
MSFLYNISVLNLFALFYYFSALCVVGLGQLMNIGNTLTPKEKFTIYYLVGILIFGGIILQNYPDDTTVGMLLTVSKIRNM